MMQLWLASVLLYCEKVFKRIKGFASIPVVVAQIEVDEESDAALPKAA